MFVAVAVLYSESGRAANQVHERTTRTEQRCSAIDAHRSVELGELLIESLYNTNVSLAVCYQC